MLERGFAIGEASLADSLHDDLKLGDGLLLEVLKDECGPLVEILYLLTDGALET